METSECLKLPKIAGLRETSEADLTPSIALGVTPAKRLMFDLSKSAYQTGAPRHLAYQQSFSHLDKLRVCDGGHG